MNVQYLTNVLYQCTVVELPRSVVGLKTEREVYGSCSRVCLRDCTQVEVPQDSKQWDELDVRTRTVVLGKRNILKQIDKYFRRQESRRQPGPAITECKRPGEVEACRR